MPRARTGRCRRPCWGTSSPARRRCCSGARRGRRRSSRGRRHRSSRAHRSRIPARRSGTRVREGDHEPVPPRHRLEQLTLSTWALAIRALSPPLRTTRDSGLPRRRRCIAGRNVPIGTREVKCLGDAAELVSSERAGSAYYARRYARPRSQRHRRGRARHGRSGPAGRARDALLPDRPRRRAVRVRGGARRRLVAGDRQRRPPAELPDHPDARRPRRRDPATRGGPRRGPRDGRTRRSSGSAPSTCA